MRILRYGYRLIFNYVNVSTFLDLYMISHYTFIMRTQNALPFQDDLGMTERTVSGENMFFEYITQLIMRLLAADTEQAYLTIVVYL